MENQKEQQEKEQKKNENINNQQDIKMDKPDLTSIVLTQQKQIDIQKQKMIQLEEKVNDLYQNIQQLQQQQMQILFQQNSPSRKGSLAIFSQYGTPQMQNQQQQNNSAVSNINNGSGQYRPHSKSINGGNLNPQRKDSNNYLNLKPNIAYTRKFTEDIDILNDTDRAKSRVDGQFGSISINNNKRTDSFNLPNISGSSQTPQFNPIVLQKPLENFNQNQFQVLQEENGNNSNNNTTGTNNNNNLNSTDDLNNNEHGNFMQHKDSKMFHIPTPQFKSSMAEQPIQYNFPPVAGGDQIINAPFSLENPYAHKLSLHKFSININDQETNPFFPNLNDYQTKRRSSGSLYFINNQQYKDNNLQNKNQEQQNKNENKTEENPNSLQQQVKQEEDQNQQQKGKQQEPQFDFPTISNINNEQMFNTQNQNNFGNYNINLALQYQNQQNQQQLQFPSIQNQQSSNQTSQKFNNNRKMSTGLQGSDENNPFNLQPMKSFKRKFTLTKSGNQEQNSYNNLPMTDIQENGGNNNQNQNQNTEQQQQDKYQNQNYNNNQNGEGNTVNNISQNNTNNCNNNMANKKIPGKNVPLFIGTRLKNCLRFDCPIKRDIEKIIIENGKYKYDDFLKWLDDPLMKLKEIWHFQITWTIYQKESEQEKYFKQIFKKASIMFLQNYAINSIIWSGQSLHSLTVSNSNVKKPAVLKKIGKFMQGINNSEKLRGMFNEKKDMDISTIPSQNVLQSQQQMENSSQNNQNQTYPIKKTSLQEEMIEEINKKQKLDVTTQ